MNDDCRKSNAVTSKESVIAYLRAAFKATEIQIVNAVSKHQEEVEKGELLRSMAYYVGNKIASAEGFEENPNFNPDEESE